ncbi:MAG: restriction endonuclease subunit S, partial [Holosporales bacterium]|nr:restriction endonuclease subunit S [Holosporales bacterium]
NNLKDGKIEFNGNTKKASHHEYQKYKKDIGNNTILLSINGTLGNIALYNNEKCILGKSVCYLNVKKNTDKTFIRYVLTDNKFQSYIDNVAHGTTIKNVSLKTLREYTFLLPPLLEQKPIASILSSLDDKIDLLYRQNKTLEALAETLFRQWFVEEADESWKEGKLGDIVELLYGKGLKDNIRTGNGYPVVGSSGIVGYHSEYLVKGPGIVIGRKGTLGKAIYLFENFFPIDTTYYVKSKTNTDTLLYEYFLLKTINFAEMNTDSAVPGLNRDMALSTEILIPPYKIRGKFNEICSCLMKKMCYNDIQIGQLEALRDSLLPKLMSGEVGVFGGNNE